MIDQKHIADPKARYGPARAATRSFIAQRLTGMLNVLFLGFFVWLVVRLAGAERAELVAVVGNPLVGAVLALLIVNVCIHMRIGLREVIEDYLHEGRVHRLALGVNDIFVLGVALLALGSIAKLVFWG
jgi:succinate dehydrogenase / fumarate reductase, membrane anchor subunit